MTTTTCVQVKLELGHRAILREQITNDGFTHDWTVFVRGPESCNIHHFVEKVIFHLHRDFAKPKRVVKEPPYEVSESGYGSFNMAIEVYFKQKEEPKKVDFDYDLFLKTQSSVNHIRCEKLTFQNPTEEFRKKLIKAGAVGIVQPESGCLLPLTPHHYQRPSTPNLITGTSSSQGKDRKAVSLAIKAPKSSTSASSLPLSGASNATQLKDTASPVNSVKQLDIAKSLAPAAPAKPTFLDLFGQPINKTSKHSPEPQKVKNSQSKKSSSLSNRNSSSTSGKEISRSSENIYINNQTAKDPNKSQVKEKIFSKRPQSPSPDSPHVGHKKRKRSCTSSPSSHGSSRSKDVKEVDSRVADKKVNVVKSKSEKKEKIKSGGGKVVEGRPDAKSGREVKAVKKLKERVLASSPSLSTNSSVGSNSELTRPAFTPPQPRTNYEGDVCGGGEESRSSTSSFSSSVHPYKGSGPLVALMAELDDEQDDQDDVLSPLSSDGSPPRNFIKQEPPQPPPSSTHHKSPPDIKSSAKISHDNKVSSKAKLKEEKSKETKAKKSSEQHKLSKKYTGKESSSEFEPPMKPPRPVHMVEINEEYISELQDLQRRILLLKDRKHLQQIVNVIEETGLYQVTSTTFDFDLCSLDRGTVKKLQSCLALIA